MALTICILLAILICYFFIDGVLRVRSHMTLVDFFLYGGNLKPPGYVGTAVSTNVSLGNLVMVFALWGSTFGWTGMLWCMITLAINSVSYLVLAPKFSNYFNDRSNFGSIHDYLAGAFPDTNENPYRGKMRAIASLSTIICLLLATALELNLGAEFLAPLLHVNQLTLFCSSVAAISLLATLGGFRSVVITDVVQGILIAIGTAILGVLFIMHTSFDAFAKSLPAMKSGSDALRFLGRLGWANSLSICVVAAGWFHVSMDQWQRASAMRNSANARSYFNVFIAILMALSAVYVYAGIFDSHIIAKPPATTEVPMATNPLANLFTPNCPLADHPISMGIVASMLFVAALSTADTFLIVCGHSFVTDVVVGVLKQSSLSSLNDIDNKVLLVIARGSIMIMGAFIFAAWALMQWAGFLADPLTAFYVAYSSQFALLAPLLQSLRSFENRPTARGIFVTIAIGLFSSIGVGSIAGYAMNTGVETILGITPADLGAISPVITVVVGLFVSELVRVVERIKT